MGRLDGRVAIITGAARGIGAAYARRFADEGAAVACADILDCAGVVRDITGKSGRAIGLHTDVSEEAGCENLVSQTVEAFGKIDVLVNNAAVFADLERRIFTEIDVAEWDRLMAVNVRGVFLCSRAVVPEMRRNGYGKIVNIASSTVNMGVPLMLHYVSSKGAVFAMTRAMARELGDANICVNSISPGLTMSEGVAAQRDSLKPNIELSLSARSFKRDELPEDLVGTAVFLASADSDFMTGQTIVVDGGQAMN